MELGLESEAWYAIRVKPRFEKRVALVLERKGYERFLPSYKAKRRYSKGTRREVELPLFPGYVFCRFNAQFRLPILKTPGVIHVLGINGMPVQIDSAEIESIKRCVESIAILEPWPFLDRGRKVRLDDGPLAGVEGIVLATQGSCRLVVSISLLCRSVAVVVDRHWITGLPISSGSTLVEDELSAA